MKYLSSVGVVLIIWGIVDFGASYAGIDVYYDWFGIDVGGLYPFTHWIAGGIGVAMTYLGSQQNEG